MNDNELNFDSRNQTSYGRDLLIPNSYNDDYISDSDSNLSNCYGNGLYKYNFHVITWKECNNTQNTWLRRLITKIACIFKSN